MHRGVKLQDSVPCVYREGQGFSLPAEKFRNLPSTIGAWYFAGAAQNFRHVEIVRAKNWAQNVVRARQAIGTQ